LLSFDFPTGCQMQKINVTPAADCKDKMKVKIVLCRALNYAGSHRL
jgi:hypothetical protein